MSLMVCDTGLSLKGRLNPENREYDLPTDVVKAINTMIAIDNGELGEEGQYILAKYSAATLITAINEYRKMLGISLSSKL